LARADANMGDLVQRDPEHPGTPPKLWWNRGGVPKSMTLDDLQRPLRTHHCGKDAFYGAHHKKFKWR